MHIYRRLLFLLIASLLIFGSYNMPVQAAITFTVNTTAETDDANPGNAICADSGGKCSLRAAIQEANAYPGDETITLPAGTYNLTKQLNISQNLIINGAGKATTILDGAGSSGAKGFYVTPTIQFEINNLTMQDFPKAIYILGDNTNHGQVFISNSTLRNNPNTDTNDSGSALTNYCEGCTVTFTQSSITNNSSPACGAITNQGILNINDNSHVDNNHAMTSTGGGICNNGGQLGVSLSYIQDNVADGPSSIFGGGIYQSGGSTGIYQSRIQGNTAGTGGGIYVGGGTLGVQFSTVIGNSASAGGGIYNSGSLIQIDTSNIQENQATSGGGIFSWEDMLIVNSAIVDNTATGEGGGLHIHGGDVTMLNSTVSGNQAYENGGGIFTYLSFALKLGSVTISNNTADADNNNDGTEGGGGIYLYTSDNRFPVTIKNTIIAGNHSLTSSPFELYKPDCVGTLTSAGYNLIGRSNFCTVTGNLSGVQIGLSGNIDPLLGPLTLGGYSTYHHPLAQFGPAVDRGNPAGCTDFSGTALTSDQRGELRVFGSGVPVYRARCDLGSVESSFLRRELFVPLIMKN